jgi:hypothetical protein
MAESGSIGADGMAESGSIGADGMAESGSIGADGWWSRVFVRFPRRNPSCLSFQYKIRYRLRYPYNIINSSAAGFSLFYFPFLVIINST